MLAAALEELSQCAAFFVAWQSPTAGFKATGAHSLEIFKGVCKGVKWMLKTAVSQSPYWLTAEKGFLSAEAKSQACAGAINEALIGCKADDDMEIKKCIEQLPLWRETLRSVVVKPIESELQAALQRRVDHLTNAAKKGVSEALATDAMQSRDLIQTAEKMLKQPGDAKGKGFYSVCARAVESIADQILTASNASKAAAVLSPYMEARQVNV